MRACKSVRECTDHFVPSQVSGFDCFHPSAAGQKEISRVSWSVGPFRAYTR